MPTKSRESFHCMKPDWTIQNLWFQVYPPIHQHPTIYIISHHFMLPQQHGGPVFVGTIGGCEVRLFIYLFVCLFMNEPEWSFGVSDSHKFRSVYSSHLFHSWSLGSINFTVQLGIVQPSVAMRNCRFRVEGVKKSCALVQVHGQWGLRHISYEDLCSNSIQLDSLKNPSKRSSVNGWGTFESFQISWAMCKIHKSSFFLSQTNRSISLMQINH